ncbi:hypothetical protein EON63_22940 [archaeon]|nr:MAG: hypothetical protein EON63_22940 [archaeon]
MQDSDPENNPLGFSLVVGLAFTDYMIYPNVYICIYAHIHLILMSNSPEINMHTLAFIHTA